jgi:hypothetical protein
MKKLFTVLSLFVAGVSANAAVFINNNTGCDVSVQLAARDANLPSSCSYYAWVEIAAGTARAYNNVTDLNPWTLNSIGFPNYATMTTTGAMWDAAWIFDAPTFIGNPGTCASGTSISYTPPGSSCTYNATWTNLGGGNVLINIVP